MAEKLHESRGTVPRLGCSWCGAPSGVAGTTLRRVTRTHAAGYDREDLCQACFDEYARFGRRLSWSDWLALWMVEVWRAARFVLQLRGHWTQLRMQWRFRVRGVKVRAELADRAAARR